MKIINQQSYDKSINGVLSNRTSVPWYFCNKNVKDTVSFSGNKPENRIPESIEQVDINPKADNESCEIKENEDGTKTIMLKKTKEMYISNKKVNMPVEMTTVTENADGTRKEAEIVKRSEKFPYEYDIYSYSQNEKPVQTSTNIKTENGSMTNQVIKSVDNTKQMTRIQKNEGNKTELKYKKIINSKAYDDIVRTFEKIDDTHTKSTVAGVTFETTFLPDKIVSKRISPYFPEPKTVELDFKQLDPRLMDLYKQLPGDYFFSLKEAGTRVLLGHRAEQNNACYYDGDNTISMSEELKNNPYAFAHEYGHAVDYRLRRFYTYLRVTDPFKAENAYFQKNATETEKEIVGYLTGPDKSPQKLLSEITAETFAIASGLKNDSEIYMLRDVVLQKYFSRTINEISDAQNGIDMFM